MRCLVISDDEAWKDLFNPTLAVDMLRVSPEECAPGGNAILFDLRDEAWDLELYKKFPDNPIFIAGVQGTLALHDAPKNLVRMNCWANMLAKSIIECSADPGIQLRAEEILHRLNKKIEWVPDEIGMVSPRVISMIINEAWFALEEGVSSQAEIDLAMQLGTNYPFGPFVWGEKIGLKKIVSLLEALQETNPRYEIADTLIREANT